MRFSNLKQLSDDTRYRLMVFSRCVAAIAGGYLLASLSVSVISFIFFHQQHLATYSGMMLSYVIWLLVILWVFSTSSAKRAWIGVGSALIVAALLSAALKAWRLS